MSFQCQPQSRLYSDKAVQTECPMAGTDSSGADLSSGIADLAINELLSRSGGAYKQSKPSRMPTPSLSRDSVNGKTWLEYSHPSCDSRGVQRRVVSQPDSVACEPKSPHADSGRPRIVSLPEAISLRSCVSNAVHYLQDLERQSPCYREYPPDLPHTPSPPSSPDSVVIVHETLPSPFFQPHEDENGWTTWANSPPRPIPALHGPSSLPYARCPSGAEGTVVEGDDLATKVWGLGSDEGHRLKLKSPQPRSSASSAPLPLDDNFDYQTVTSSALARHRDAVIDLVKPSTFYSNPKAYDSAGGRLVSSDGTHSSLGRPNLYASPRSYQDMRSTASSKDCPERLGKELAGRGLARQSNLNSAAPSFIPTYSARNTNSQGACVHQDAEFGDFEYAYTPRDLRQQHASNSDLTPASTSSPLWSPVFHSNPTIVLRDYNPRIYSPDLDSYSNKFIAQQLNEDFMSVQQRRHAEQNIKASSETFHAQPYIANNAVCSKNTNAVSATHPSPLAFYSLTEAESSEIRNHLSHQQPRSVPMTHLMQRRLSSVVEENV